MLICAELLLANTLDNGHTVNQGNDLQISLAGAALCELAGRGLVIVDADGAIRSVSDDAAGDALLEVALSHFAERVGKSASKGLDALGKDVLEGTRDRLVEEGVGRIEPKKHFRRERLFVDSATRSELIGRLCDVLRGTAAPDLHTGSLIGLLAASADIHRVIPPEHVGMTKQELHQRATQIGDADWPRGAVAEAVTNARKAALAASLAESAVVTAAVTAATTATT